MIRLSLTEDVESLINGFDFNGFSSSISPQVANSFTQITSQSIRAFATSQGALSKVNAFLDGGQGDPCALFFFCDKGQQGLRQVINWTTRGCLTWGVHSTTHRTLGFGTMNLA